jgi:hypothetical protein
MGGSRGVFEAPSQAANLGRRNNATRAKCAPPTNDEREGARIAHRRPKVMVQEPEPCSVDETIVVEGKRDPIWLWGTLGVVGHTEFDPLPGLPWGRGGVPRICVDKDTGEVVECDGAPDEEPDEPDTDRALCDSLLDMLSLENGVCGDLSALHSQILLMDRIERMSGTSAELRTEMESACDQYRDLYARFENLEADLDEECPGLYAPCALPKNPAGCG